MVAKLIQLRASSLHIQVLFTLGGACDMVAASRELLVVHRSTLANPRCTLLNAL